jgi:hypothetical protein
MHAHGRTCGHVCALMHAQVLTDTEMTIPTRTRMYIFQLRHKQELMVISTSLVCAPTTLAIAGP